MSLVLHIQYQLQVSNQCSVLQILVRTITNTLWTAYIKNDSIHIIKYDKLLQCNSTSNIENFQFYNLKF